MLTTHDIRQKYLDFFQSKGHILLSSASLLPDNDPTTLFTGSGMQPMVPYLLGQKHPQGVRLTDSQRCFRTQDIDEVGDNRHTTFFEMLGNWSLGDYFKREQIPWIYEFLTGGLKLDPQRLYFTCFRGKPDSRIPRDEESARLWQELLAKDGVDAKIVDYPERDGASVGRIFYYDETKNWWSRAGEPDKMPIGEPGGGDSEIFWDFGAARGLHEKSKWKDKLCHVNCDCGRFLEIGNSVFMEYQKNETGFAPLPQKNVDFGGGLERLAAALADNPDIFQIDLFSPIREALEKNSEKVYGQDKNDTRAFRVIMDHIRAAVWLIADGAVPGNKDQGYFTRRLIRRSIRFARELGMHGHAMPALGQAILDAYQTHFPAIADRADEVVTELKREEDKFRKTLDLGLKKFTEVVKNLPAGGQIEAEASFDLYQNYGFPLEMTAELAEELGLTVDKNGFTGRLKEHQNLSRQGSQKKFHGGLADHSEMSIKYHTATHLLHAALRQVLGETVEQRGSNITPERLRFDFSYPNKMTADEIKRTVDLVNAAIERDYAVSFAEMTVGEARQKRAIGLFPDRYDAIVKVYTIGDPEKTAKAGAGEPTFSREICGGPHVAHTGVIGNFKIVKEEACSAGIRRIKAVIM